MKKIEDFNNRNIEYILCDVDDTLTNNGKLYTKSLEALWLLHDSNYKIIPVTGGSAGWADLYLRQWPIDAVITESGAIAFYKEGNNFKKFYHPSIDIKNYKKKSELLIKDVLDNVKDSKLSNDQFARIFDIAFDYHSEPPFLEKNSIDKIISIAKKHGANYAVSSIHVNIWFGEYDKYLGTKDFFSSIYSISLDDIIAKCIYVGDSLNDQIMFKHFSNSFAVSNIKDKLPLMNFKPNYIASEKGGLGFNQIAKRLIELKS